MLILNGFSFYDIMPVKPFHETNCVHILLIVKDIVFFPQELQIDRLIVIYGQTLILNQILTVRD